MKQEKLYNYYMKILNIPSQNQQVVIEEMPAHPVCSEMDSPLTFDELLLALGHLKVSKVVGRAGGIMPELLSTGGIARLATEVNAGYVGPRVCGWDWRDAVVVPIPKNGDLKLCDNWRV